MTDSSIVTPGNSSYSLPTETVLSAGQIPQMSMERVLPRQQSTGSSRGVQQFGTPNLYADSGDNQIIAVKNDVNQTLMGDQPTFGEGFYVTKPGIDVKTAKSLDDFIFNSSQNIFKVAKVGYAYTSYPAGAFSHVTIRHGLGFIPPVQAYLYGQLSYTGASFFPLPFETSSSLDLVNHIVNAGIVFTVFTDAQNVYIQCANATANPTNTYYIRYYLFQESIPASTF